jgi:lipopolysaccharide/colanic/teichoic acid biosynthesis glycosyltransferase
MRKRAIDIVISMIGLFGLAPMFVIVAVMIKFDSAGPIFFRQERMGRGLNPFRIIKFRTMTSDMTNTTPSLAIVSSARITRIGRWLRSLKIDELPQLVNVLKGDMSLVGPRPELRRYVELRRHEYEMLLAVRPGMTDPASLAYHDEARRLAHAKDPEKEYVTKILPAKIRLSQQYVALSTICEDSMILLRTLRLLGRMCTTRERKDGRDVSISEPLVS